MPRITVKAKIDGGTHLKYGEIKKGQEYEIEEEHFGDQLFERPPGFESPHEKAQKQTSDPTQETGLKGPVTSLRAEALQPAKASDQPETKAGKGPRSPVTGLESTKEGGE